MRITFALIALCWGALVSAPLHAQQATPAAPQTPACVSNVGLLNHTVAILQQVDRTVIDASGTRSESFKGAIGAGIFIRDNLVATAYHVVDDVPADKLFVQLHDKDRSSVAAKLVYANPQMDLAFVSVSVVWQSFASRLMPKPVAATAGEKVRFIGSPLGAAFTLRLGTILGEKVLAPFKDLPLRSVEGYEVDGFVEPGNSGGPVFSCQGKLLGLVSSRYPNPPIKGLFIGTNGILRGLSDYDYHQSLPKRP